MLWVVEFYDQFDGGVAGPGRHRPALARTASTASLWAPLLHGGFAHLAANTLPFIAFGFLVLANGIGRFVFVTAVIWVLAGLGVWLTAPYGSVTVGMSGVIFGWLTYLLVRGFFARSGTQILLAVVVFFLWGGILLGVLPGQQGVSWQGHLFGALAGVFAAWLVARPSRPATTSGTLSDRAARGSAGPGGARSRLGAWPHPGSTRPSASSTPASAGSPSPGR